MKKYEIPNKFYAGARANAEEVNENFQYLTDILNTQRDVIRNLQEEIEDLTNKV